MEQKVSTGVAEFDRFLNGGYEKDTVTTLYGPAGTGKTNFCLLCLKDVAKKGKKAIYIDTEGSFSMERFKQINRQHQETLKSVFFLKPTSFTEQKTAFDKLKSLINDRIGLIVVDTISTYYRLEAGRNRDIYRVNREFGLQLSNLVEIARKNHIPVLVTSQVYSKMESAGGVNIVGGDIIRYSSKCLIELRKSDHSRAAIIRKHRSIPEGRKIFFKITNRGVETVRRKDQRFISG